MPDPVNPFNANPPPGLGFGGIGPSAATPGEEGQERAFFDSFSSYGQSFISQPPNFFQMWMSSFFNNPFMNFLRTNIPWLQNFQFPGNLMSAQAHYPQVQSLFMDLQSPLASPGMQIGIGGGSQPRSESITAPVRSQPVRPPSPPPVVNRLGSVSRGQEIRINLDDEEHRNLNFEGFMMAFNDSDRERTPHLIGIGYMHGYDFGDPSNRQYNSDPNDHYQSRDYYNGIDNFLREHSSQIRVRREGNELIITPLVDCELTLNFSRLDRNPSYITHRNPFGRPVDCRREELTAGAGYIPPRGPVTLPSTPVLDVYGNPTGVTLSTTPPPGG